MASVWSYSSYFAAAGFKKKRKVGSKGEGVVLCRCHVCVLSLQPTTCTCTHELRCFHKQLLSGVLSDGTAIVDCCSVFTVPRIREVCSGSSGLDVDVLKVTLP